MSTSRRILSATESVSSSACRVAVSMRTSDATKYTSWRGSVKLSATPASSSGRSADTSISLRNRSTRARRSPSTSGPGGTSSGARWMRATRYGSFATKSSSCTRSSPCTIARTLPSGMRAIWWIAPAVPTRCTFSAAITPSGRGSRCAAKTSSRLLRMTSSMTRTAAGFTTSSGTAVNGNTTPSGSGRTGKASGSVNSAGPPAGGVAIVVAVRRASAA